MDYQDGNLTTLLLQKEKELQNLSKMRVMQLQEQLSSKDQTIFELEAQIRRLHDDFNYNLTLIQQRDEEIADLEEKINDMSFRNMGKSPMNTYWSQDEQASSGRLREIYIKDEELKNANDKILLLENKLKSVDEIEIQLQSAKSEISRLVFERDSEKEKNSELIENLNELKIRIEKEKNEVGRDWYMKERYYKENEEKLMKNKLDLEKENFEWKRKLNVVITERDIELEQIRNKHEIDMEHLNANKQAIIDNLNSDYKEQISKLQFQIKQLLEENSKNSQYIEQTNTQFFDNERRLTEEIYELRNDMTYKLNTIEQLKNALQNKSSELDNIKLQLEHWKNQANLKSEECLKIKQNQIKYQSKAEDLEKELISYKDFHLKEINNLTNEMQARIDAQQKQHFSDEKIIKKLEKDNKILSQRIENIEKHKQPHEYQEIVFELERARDEIFTKDRELNRVNKVLESIRKDKDKILQENQQFRDANVRLICDKKPADMYDKLQDIENNIGMIHNDISNIKQIKVMPFNYQNSRSKSVIGYNDTLSSNPDRTAKPSKILQVKKKLDRKFSKFDNF
ncbi:unnamed protein product [Blepharisma stoltei]|uniref:Uncharacterized protein n=1 Tax=Blepharisma stoltei TaxID=1481888 RepID=A0AAU9JLR4_9CILI|nr:unnamed protein product [Blepharisma stoltei]